MPPSALYLDGGARETSFSLLAAALLALACLLMLLVPRKYCACVIVVAASLIPMSNVLVIGGCHLMPVRILVVAGWIRLLMLKLSGRAVFPKEWIGLDKLFFGWAISRSTAILLLWRSSSAITNQVGFLWGALGMYFLLRCFIRDNQDIKRVIYGLIVVAVLIAPEMIYEQITHQNLFTLVLGNVKDAPLIRAGRVRSQGAFGHAILAGTFGATLLPLWLWLDRKRKSYMYAVAGAITSAVLVLTSASSTPVLAYFTFIGVCCFWPFRNLTRKFWSGVCLLLVVLHLAMKSPVWFLIGRVDVIGSSAGFDRAYLIDTFIRHFSDWWLVGTNANGDWGWSMWDTSNQFVEEGNRGGLLTFCLFVAMLLLAFHKLRQARLQAANRSEAWGAWLLSAAMLAHVAAFFGVSYWDQMQVSWFFLLATISVVTTVSMGRLQVYKQQTKTSAFVDATTMCDVSVKCVEPIDVRAAASVEEN